MNEILSAFEFFDKQALDFTLSVLPEVKAPLQSSSHPFYAIIETAGSNRQHNEEKLKVCSGSLQYINLQLEETPFMHKHRRTACNHVLAAKMISIF